MHLPEAASGTIGGVIILLIIFLLAVQPAWCFIDCLITPEFSKSTKIIWGVLLLLTWYFTGFFYGVFGTRSSSLRSVTLGSIVVIAIGLGVLFATGQHTSVATNMASPTPKAIPKNTPAIKTKPTYHSKTL